MNQNGTFQGVKMVGADFMSNVTQFGDLLNVTKVKQCLLLLKFRKRQYQNVLSPWIFVRYSKN